MWEIKGKDNQTKAIPSTKPEYNGEWMGESYVTVTVESPAPVDFEIGDYIIYRDERFEINYDPGKIKSAPRYKKGDAFKYENIKFNSLADELTRCDFLDVVLEDNQLHFTGLPKFSFYGGVRDLANRMQANLDRTYGKGTWRVVVSPEYSGTKETNISVDTIKVRGALSILVNDLETYYTIKGRTMTIGAAGVPADHLFTYGKGNGLYEIEQNAEADQAIVTRLRAYGSTRNLPHRYYNSLSGADGQKLIPDNMAVQYLMLPEFPYTTQDPYIDSPNKAKLGIREGTVFFDGSGELEEIYPSIEGVTAEDLHKAGVPCNSTGALDEIVSAEQIEDNGVGEVDGNETKPADGKNTFKVVLKDLGFDIWEHRIAGTTPIMSFKTGMLGGRDFEIVGCKKIEKDGETAGYELELNRVYDDGIQLWFPYAAYNAHAGDKFVILHIEMPEVYIKAAAIRLKEAAEEWLSKNDYSRSIYAPKIDEIFMARQHDIAMASGGKIKSLHDTLKEGMLLLFEDEDLNIDASIFIDRLTIKEEGAVPTYEVVLKEEKTVGRLDKMQNQIDSLAAGKGQGGGGYTAAQIRSLISAYGGSMFLSKLKDDRTLHKISTNKGFEAGEYVAEVSGGMLGIDGETGDSFAEVDRLWVRVKAFFEELTVVKAGVLAGKQYITPGGGVVCFAVEETDTAYRCYFLSEQDGEKTETRIVAGDQAISEMFNARTGTDNKVSNHRYWRLVTAVDNDAYTDASGNHYGYIDLSKTDCEAGSSIPQAGDEICQLGNRTDATRQAAMVFSTVDADAPSVKLFGGINSYSLAGKAIISFGREPSGGKVYFRLGASGASQYLEYNQDGGLELAGRLSVLSTVGDKTLGDFVRDEARVAQFVLDVDNQVSGVSCDAAGNVVGDYPQGRVTVYRDGSKYEGDVVYRVVATEGISALVDREGVVSFTAITAMNASVAVEAVVVDKDVVLRGTFSRFKVLPGSAVSKTEVFYSSVFTATRPAESTFTLTNVPAVPAGMYLWSVVVTYYTDETSSRAYSVSRQGLDYGAGKMLTGLNDPTFKKGVNRVMAYNNSPTKGRVTVTRVADSTAPNDSGYVLRIRSVGATTPGCGGCTYDGTYNISKPNKTFVQRVIARVPVGHSVVVASNLLGDGGTRTLISNSAGTGDWEEYLVRIDCGATGTFGAYGYLYLAGPQGTNESPVEWDVAYSTVFDMGANGDFQVAEKSVTYARSTSSAQPADSAFVYGSIDEAGPSVGDYLWTRTSVTYSDGTTVTSYSVGRIGSDGTNGLPGAPGADGRTTYVHYAYASSEDGSEDFSREYFAGAKYVGVRTDYDREDPEDWRLYEWARLRGEDARVYSLLVSVGTVRRNPDGTFTPSKISCEKRLTKGDGVELTTDYYLYYRFVLGEESAANWVIGAGPGNSTFESAIPSGARWIDFELRTNNSAEPTILASERVMVLTDAADMEVGGTNLLKNSDFIDGVRYWTNNVVDSGGTVAVLDRATAPGWLEGRATMHVRYASGTATWRSLYQRIAAGKVRAGEVYMLSGWVYVPSQAAMTKTVYAKIHRELTDGSSYNQELIDFRGVTAGRWCYVSKMWKAPATLDMSKDVWVMFQLEQYGEFYLNGWKFEKGNVATGWSASPEDVSYLRTALRESTTIDGGLIAATLLKLGYTLEGGEYRVTAGMNGVVTPDADDIAFWSGGGMVDAEKEPDSEDAATFVIRHSGEAYACRNTVRFKSNRIEVGAPGARKSVVLDDDGLKLVDGSEERLRVVHQSVGSLADAASSQLISGPGVKSHVIYLRQLGGGSSLGGIQARKSYQISRGFETAAFSVGSSGATLNAGAAIKMTARVGFVYDTREETSTPGIYDSYPLSGSMRVRIYSTAGTVLCNRSVALRTTDGRNHVAELSLNETVKTAGVYLAKIYLEGVTAGSGSDAGTASASVSASGSVQLGYADQTIMGSDGFMTKWGNAALLARAGEVHAKVGTTELVVLESGIKAIVNGKEIWLAQ